MFKLFIDSKELDSTPVIQNEIGVYYYNLKRGLYFKPFLKDFNTANPPKGYLKYGPKRTQAKPYGSHWLTDYLGENIRRQMAIDFSVPRLRYSRLTSNIDWKLQAVSGEGKFKTAKWVSGKVILGMFRWSLFTVHVKNLPPIGTVVKAGKRMTTVYYDHFHLFIQRFGLPYPIRKIVLA